MPALYTHFAIAKDTYTTFDKNLKRELRPYLSYYFFGANGADFCFFYQFLKTNIPNLGSYLHRKGGYTAFSVLQLFAEKRMPFLAYALGYITHYACDCTFHPFVYAKSGALPFKHNQVESVLDLYFAERTSDATFAEFFRKPLGNTEEEELYLLYTAIAVKCGFPPLSKTSFSRAISLFQAYPNATKSPFLKRILANKKEFFNESRQAWQAPFRIAPNHDSAQDLYDKSIQQASADIDIFLKCLQEKKRLPKTPFSKNFLTGDYIL